MLQIISRFFNRIIAYVTSRKILINTKRWTIHILLTKKSNQSNTRKNRIQKLKNERFEKSERYLSHMDYMSTLFCIEDAINHVKIATNAPDAIPISKPFCGSCIEYDTGNEQFLKLINSPLIIGKCTTDKVLLKNNDNNKSDTYESSHLIGSNKKKPLSELKKFLKNDSLSVRAGGGVHKATPQCTCDRRTIYLHNTELNAFTLKNKNLIECANGFINETPFCICQPASSYFFDQGTIYAHPELCNDVVSSVHHYMMPMDSDTYEKADNLFKSVIFLVSRDESLLKTTLSNKNLSNFEIYEPVKPKYFEMTYLNIQYAGFFEFYLDDEKNKDRNFLNEIHFDLLNFDTEIKQNLDTNYPHMANNFLTSPNNNNHTLSTTPVQNNYIYSYDDDTLFKNNSIALNSVEKVEKDVHGDTKFPYQQQASTLPHFKNYTNVDSINQIPTHQIFDNCTHRLFCFEHIDYGSLMYRHRFFGRYHQNILLIDPTYGPIVISIRTQTIRNQLRSSFASIQKDDVLHENDSYFTLKNKKFDKIKRNVHSVNISNYNNNNLETKMKREADEQSIFFKHSIIVRTSSLICLRATLFEGLSKNCSIKKILSPDSTHRLEVINFIQPDLDLSNGVALSQCPAFEKELLKLDEAGLHKKLKVGMLYCGNNQSTEEEIYNNKDGSKYFKEFLNLIGTEVRLKGFSTINNPKFYAQLDIEQDRTGTHSIYTKYYGREIMFHVSTMIPYSETNKQQIDRKRHIGNDIVVVVFQEQNAHPLDPTTFHTQFTHVVICVKHNSNGEYTVSVARKNDVPYFGPPIAKSYKKDSLFREFILTKIINAENASYRANKFYTMAIRTRYQMLKHMITSYSSISSISSTKDSNNSSGNTNNLQVCSQNTGGGGIKLQKLRSFQKKMKNSESIFPISPELFVYNGVSWDVKIFNCQNIIGTKCKMIIAYKILMFVDIIRKEPLLTIEFANIYFWKATTSKRIDIYYKPKQMLMVICDKNSLDEFPFIVCRLRFFLKCMSTVVIKFKRLHNINDNLVINNKGIVTYINNKCSAYKCGLRCNMRVIEIFRIPLLTISYSDFLNILKDPIYGDNIVLTVLSDEESDIAYLSPKINNAASLNSINSTSKIKLSDNSRSIDSNNDLFSMEKSTRKNQITSVQDSFQADDSKLSIGSPISKSIDAVGYASSSNTKMNALKNNYASTTDAEESEFMEDSDIDSIFKHLEESLQINHHETVDNWTYIKGDSKPKHSYSHEHKRSSSVTLVTSSNKVNLMPMTTMSTNDLLPRISKNGKSGFLNILSFLPKRKSIDSRRQSALLTNVEKEISEVETTNSKGSDLQAGQ